VTEIKKIEMLLMHYIESRFNYSHSFKLSTLTFKISMLLITYCSITEFGYEVKKSLEYNGICDVIRIYTGTFKDGEEMKKVMFLRIKWLGTQAAASFEASLIHNWGAKVYKLDRWYQPIVTKVDEYGNAIQYEKWIVEPARYQKITEWKNNIEGEFTVWSHPDHEDDPDEDEVEPEPEPEQEDYEEEEEQEPFPELKRCNPVIPGEGLSLEFPVFDEPEVEKEPTTSIVFPPKPKLVRQTNAHNVNEMAYSQAENDAEIRKLFDIQDSLPFNSKQKSANIAVKLMSCSYELEELQRLLEGTPFYDEIKKMLTRLAEISKKNPM
jgi:hypothetical protein